MGDWCGALCSDAKDYDITGAMFVNDDGDDIFNAIFWQGFVWGIDTGWLMGDPQSRLHQSHGTDWRSHVDPMFWRCP
jgi:hypothetical protein